MTSTNGSYPYHRNEDKNQLLIQERGISFDDIVECIATGGLLDIISHHDQDHYPHQQKLIVLHNNYIYYIPFVIQLDGTMFLKTIIPSRKHTKEYCKIGKK